MSIFGTRPEAIKMAPVVRGLEAATGIDSRLCVTAQHRDMLDQVLDIFDLQPDHDLDLMRANQDLYGITTRTLNGLQPIFQEERPDVVLVHGDTTTTMAATLAAFYAHIPVCHVEAGLRTYDLSAPFPEEANRRVVSALAWHHFAPTEQNRNTLIGENIPAVDITLTGNTGIDALLMTINAVRNRPEADFSDLFGAALTATLSRRPRRQMVLVTGHRRENFGSGIENICRALGELAHKHKAVEIVYPVHMNPNVIGPVHEMLQDIPNIHLIPPLPYDAFVYLMDRSTLILTDSGGIQEEAPSLEKPVLVMRDVTERQEAIAAGTAVLVGTDKKKIVDSVTTIIKDPQAFWAQHGEKVVNPYGDGAAAARIVRVIKERLNPSQKEPT